MFIENITPKREKGSDTFNSDLSLLRAGVILVHIFFHKTRTWLKTSTFFFDKTQKVSNFTPFTAKKIAFTFRGILVSRFTAWYVTLHVCFTTHFFQLYWTFMAYVCTIFKVPCFFVVRKKNNVSLVYIPKKHKNT